MTSTDPSGHWKCLLRRRGETKTAGNTDATPDCRSVQVARQCLDESDSRDLQRLQHEHVT
jgi:hypothetical protein